MDATELSQTHWKDEKAKKINDADHKRNRMENGVNSHGTKLNEYKVVFCNR